MYSTASWTLPSHASMFTGLMPREIGLAQPPGQTPQSAKPVFAAHADRVLAEVLRRGGYETRAVTSNLWVSPACGFDLGFEQFEYIEPRPAFAAQTSGQEGWREWLSWSRTGLASTEDDGAAAALATLQRWMAEQRDRPFFWLVNLIETHSPYLPPRPWNDLGALERFRAGHDARTFQSFAGVCKIAGGNWDVPDSSLERMKYLYQQSVAYADNWLGNVVTELDERGLLDETLVLVTSDHGENLGENRLLGHLCSLDERLTRVPFVAAGPGAPAADGVRSLADLPRMIADAAELADHPWPQPRLPGGIAVSEFDSPSPPDHPKLTAFVEKHDLGEEGRERLSVPLTAATDGRHKLLVRGGAELVYDLEADPLEECPLAGAGGEIGPLREAIEQAGRAGAGTEPASAPAPGAPPNATPEELEELERQMKLLGYM